ncbi:MAG TPA: signal peptide peptidase SppA, partial [Planctomycetaceae bacterium]|nr:signal peptide peptidase SppA [Planctomycetaceae bacterium]
KVQANKPVIVSMGNVAASGGYYVASYADEILAEPTTITGSIGVVGGKFATTGLWDKLGIKWASRSRGANATLNG